MRQQWRGGRGNRVGWVFSFFPDAHAVSTLEREGGWIEKKKEEEEEQVCVLFRLYLSLDVEDGRRGRVVRGGGGGGLVQQMRREGRVVIVGRRA